MATFEIKGPDGHIYEVDAPDEQSALSAFQEIVAPKPPEKTPEQRAADALRPPGGYPSDNLANVAVPDTLREIKNDPLRQILGATGEYVDAAMLGTADEALAGLYAIGAMVPGGRSPSAAFSQELSRLEQRRRDYRAINPEQATAATITGAVVNPLNLVGGEFVAAARNAPARIGRAAGVGGGVGGVAGAASTEGGLPERATGGAIGAGLGGLAGLLGQPGAELLGIGGKKATEGGRAIINTLRNQAQASANPELQAEKLLARAFMQDDLPLGFGPAPVNQPLPGQGLVNVGGENVKNLGRLATVAPGRARQTAANFFDEQAAGATDRAADAVSNLAQRGYYGTVEELDAARRATAAPLYDAAYARPAVDQWSPRIAQVMQRPSMRAAFAKAQRIAAEEGRDPMELGLTFNEAGDPIFLEGARNGQIPSTQTMDYIKRGLDDVVEQYRDRTSGRLVLDTEGRAINNTRAEFVGLLRGGNPEYAAALDAWSGPSHALDMLEVGRDIYNSRSRPADLIRRFQELSPQDQDLARIGFVRNAVEDLGNVGDTGSVYLRLFGNQNKRAVAQVMFPDEQSFNRFAAQMRAEREMLAANKTAMGGSPTSRIDADKADAAMQGASDVLSFADAIKSGNPLRILGLAFDKGQNLARGVTPEVADALANRLFTSDPIQIQRVLSQVGAVRNPAPAFMLQPGITQFGRRTPLPAMFGYGSGQIGAAIASPQ
jgi:hypothetical protein